MSVPFQCASSIVTGAGATRNYPVTAATAAGDTLLAVVTGNNTTCTITGLTDSQGNVYTLDDSVATPAPTQYLFRCPGATGGPAGAPTVALSLADQLILTTAAVSGNIALMATDAGPVGAVDKVAVIATGTSATPSVSQTPAANNEVCVSAFSTQFSGGSPAVNSPFTSVGTPLSSGSNPFTAMAYDVLAGGSGTPQTSTETITSAGWRAGMWTFQPGAGGVSGSGALALSALALAGAGVVPAAGSGGLALGALALAGAGIVPAAGSGGLALAALALAGAGGGGVSGSGGLALAALALAGSGTDIRTLILSVAPQAGTDGSGNTYPQGVSIGALGSQQVQLLLDGLAAFLNFPSGAPIEGAAANMAAHVELSGAAQFLQVLLSGPQLNVAGHQDWAQVEMNSANAGGTSSANVLLNYIDTAGVPHLYALWDRTGFSMTGSVTAVLPGSSPASAETWHPLGTGMGASWTVNNTRYRITAEGELEIDIAVNAQSGGGASGIFTFANTLPAGYQFAGNYSRSCPLGYNGTVVAADNVPSLLIDGAGTSHPGRVRIALPALPATTNVGGTARIPLS